jgi:hypothetical protein
MNARLDRRRRGRVLALGVAAGLALVGNGPCGPLPGGKLSGEVVTEPVRDWSFAAKVRHCQVEVRPENPYSVTTYCFPDGAVLYVPAIMGEDKRWTMLAVAEPDVRIRVGDRIYPVTLQHLKGPHDRRAAAEAGYRRWHHGADPPADLEVKADCWYFRATSR